MNLAYRRYLAKTPHGIWLALFPWAAPGSVFVYFLALNPEWWWRESDAIFWLALISWLAVMLILPVAGFHKSAFEKRWKELPEGEEVQPAKDWPPEVLQRTRIKAIAVVVLINLCAGMLAANYLLTKEDVAESLRLVRALRSYREADVAYPNPVDPPGDLEKRPAYFAFQAGENYDVTLKLDGEDVTVRLYGLAPPQAEGADAPLPGWQQASKKELEHLLLGRSVRLTYDSGGTREDEQGRLSVCVWRASDDLLINLELIRVGVAQSSAGPTARYHEQFDVYSRVAQRLGIGLWGQSGESTAGSEANENQPGREEQT